MSIESDVDEFAAKDDELLEPWQPQLAIGAPVVLNFNPEALFAFAINSLAILPQSQRAYIPQSGEHISFCDKLKHYRWCHTGVSAG